MATKVAVLAVAFLQIILRTSFFFEQRSDLCSPAPALSSWIFLVALLDLLLDIDIFPVRYTHLPLLFQVIVEIVLLLLLTECATMVVCCTMEKLIWYVLKSALIVLGMPLAVYQNWEYILLGIANGAINFSLLFYVSQATGHYACIRRNVLTQLRPLYCFRAVVDCCSSDMRLWRDYLCANASTHYCPGCGAPLNADYDGCCAY